MSGCRRARPGTRHLALFFLRVGVVERVCMRIYIYIIFELLFMCIYIYIYIAKGVNVHVSMYADDCTEAVHLAKLTV